MACLRPGLCPVVMVVACSFDATGQFDPKAESTSETSSTSSEGGLTEASLPTSTAPETMSPETLTTTAVGPTSDPSSDPTTETPLDTGESCGDGVREGGEVCDGEDLGGKSCADLGLIDGVLACDSNCVFDAEKCEAPPTCGNGVLDGTEPCDGAELGGATCEGLDFTGGALSCAENCAFDTSQCESLPPGWYDKSYKKRRMLTIPASRVKGSHSDFPVVVTFTDGLIAELGDAGKLVFADADKLKYSHEVEVADAERLIVWVEVPALDDAVDRVFYVYYDNPEANNTGDPAGTWSNGFLAVWHLGDSVVDGQEGGAHVDSTMKGHSGVQHDNATAEPSACKIGRCQEFGANEWIDVDKDNEFTLGDANASIAAWVNTSGAATGGQGIFAKSNPSNASIYQVVVGLDPANAKHVLGASQGLTGSVKGTMPIVADTWRHVVWTQQKDASLVVYDRWNLYIDGEMEGTTDFISLPAAANHYVRIGGPTANSSYPGNFQGRIDEMQVSLKERSADWIATSFTNQSAPETFTLVGDAESL